MVKWNTRSSALQNKPERAFLFVISVIDILKRKCIIEDMKRILSEDELLEKGDLLIVENGPLPVIIHAWAGESVTSLKKSGRILVSTPYPTQSLKVIRAEREIDTIESFEQDVNAIVKKIKRMKNVPKI